jgi:hypothetical protein
MLSNRLQTIICVIIVGLLALDVLAVADEDLPVAEIAPILNQHPCATPCKVKENSFNYTLEPVDLNGDGRREYLVRDETRCGSGGCAEALFMRVGNDWKKLLGNFGSLQVMNKRTKGFADVVVSFSVYDPNKRTVQKTYRWDGQQYRAENE